MTYNQIKGSAEYILAQTRLRPEVAIITGNGIGNAFKLDEAVRIPYKNIPRFSVNKVESEGTLVIGKLMGTPVAVLSGRCHTYEGYTMAECAYPVAVMKALGAKKIIVTNIAGAINENYRPGDFVLISDHIKLCLESPLTGEDAGAFGTETFFDMNDAYSKDVREKLTSVWKAVTDTELKSGVYAFMGGPQFETPAEIRALKTMGADLVGMSTVPEAIMASACGMTLLGITFVSNMAAGVAGDKMSGKEDGAFSRDHSDDFIKLISAAVKVMA